jgi:AcrR family transcriptional regulator
MGSTPPSEPLDRARQIAAVGKQILDEEGPEGLSMRRLAERIGLTAPALYRYFPDKSTLEDAICSEAHWELGDLGADALRQAGVRGEDELLALAAIYRRWALAHPHLYRLVYCSPLSRNRWDPEAEQYGAELLRAVVDHDTAASARLWCFIHGIVMLELDGRMTEPMDPSAILRDGIARLRPG